MRTEGTGETTTRATPLGNAGKSGQVKSNDDRLRVVKSIVSLVGEVKCANERNVSHLQILLIKTLYYELYYYGH